MEVTQSMQYGKETAPITKRQEVGMEVVELQLLHCSLKVTRQDKLKKQVHHENSTPMPVREHGKRGVIGLVLACDNKYVNRWSAMAQSVVPLTTMHEVLGLNPDEHQYFSGAIASS